MDGYNENVCIVCGGMEETDPETINYWLGFANNIEGGN